MFLDQHPCMSGKKTKQPGHRTGSQKQCKPELIVAPMVSMAFGKRSPDQLILSDFNVSVYGLQ